MAVPPPEEQTYLLAYCERMGDPGFWGEPLNAVTNLAFILCGWMALRLIRRLPNASFRKQGDIWILIAAMFAIGIGSGLWHTHARPWTVIADVIPIYIFINIYVFSLFVRVGGMKKMQAAVVWLAFQVASVLAEIYAPKDFLNGSVMYLPSYGMLLIAIGWLAYREIAAWKDIALTTAIFTASIFCRSIDMMVCDAFPYGTHFLWHLLNAVVLYRLASLVVHVAIARRSDASENILPA